MKSRKQRSFYLEIAVYVLLLYGIHACVFLNGDDFMYGAFAKTGILENVASYYITGNGRFWINILDSVLLFFDRYLFLAVDPLIVMAFLVLLAKNIQWITEKKGDRKKERRYLRYGMVLFACMDVLCLRETVFWITGMMNYLFPAVVFLFAFLRFQQLHEGRALSGAGKLLYAAMCFFAGSSVEQYALMFVGMMTLMLGMDLLGRKKISGVLLGGYLCALVGLALMLLAPANFVRVDDQMAEMPSIADNLWTLIHQNTLSPVPFPYVLMLSMGAGAVMCRRSGAKWLRLAAVAVPLCILAVAGVPLLHRAVLIMGVCALLAVELILFFVFRKYSCKTEILSLIFVGFGSQVMLLVSAIWGFRCMFSMYVIYMLLILYCLTLLDGEKRAFVLCSGIVGSLSPAALALLWAAAFLLRKKRTVTAAGWQMLTRGAVVAALVVLLVGYGRNVPVHLQNIEQTKSVGESGELQLQELPDDLYSWYFIPMGEFHEGYYRIYHGIQDSVELVYQTKLPE